MRGLKAGRALEKKKEKKKRTFEEKSQGFCSQEGGRGGEDRGIFFFLFLFSAFFFKKKETKGPSARWDYRAMCVRCSCDGGGSVSARIAAAALRPGRE